MAKEQYESILVEVFRANYMEGASEVPFKREDIFRAADRVGVDRPKNAGDVPYTYRYRADMPAGIADTAYDGKVWIIVGRGRAQYAFRQIDDRPLVPAPGMRVIKVPDSTPGIVAQHVLNSEQALLAKLRYNRLIDLFTGIVCHSLQNHLRTSVKGIGQIETDEVYLGVDARGGQYVIPVEAKGGSDRLSIVQLQQDLALAKEKFSSLTCIIVGAQFIDDSAVALFRFEESPEREDLVELVGEKHYKLVAPSEISEADLRAYSRTLD